MRACGEQGQTRCRRGGGLAACTHAPFGAGAAGVLLKAHAFALRCVGLDDTSSGGAQTRQAQQLAASAVASLPEPSHAFALHGGQPQRECLLASGSPTTGVGRVRPHMWCPCPAGPGRRSMPFLPPPTSYRPAG